jgi:hypothetical protein
MNSTLTVSEEQLVTLQKLLENAATDENTDYQEMSRAQDLLDMVNRAFRSLPEREAY